jgi:hypothetical protein
MQTAAKKQMLILLVTLASAEACLRETTTECGAYVNVATKAFFHPLAVAYLTDAGLAHGRRARDCLAAATTTNMSVLRCSAVHVMQPDGISSTYIKSVV